MNKKTNLLMLTLIVGISSIFCIDWDEVRRLSDEEKLYGLSLIWKEVDYNFSDNHRLYEINWDKEFRKHSIEVLKSENIYEYYRVLQKFTALLKDNQTRVMFPSVLSPYLDRPRIDLREIDGKIIVHNIGVKNVDLIPIGSQILEVNGLDVYDYLNDEVIPYTSAGNDDVLMLRALGSTFYQERESKVKLKIKEPNATVKNVEIECVSGSDYWAKDATYADDLLLHRWLDDDILYVVLYRFHDPLIIKMFESIIPDLEKCNGLIIDLQENNYGDGKVSSQIMKHFVTEKEMPGFIVRTRMSVAHYKALGTPNASFGYLPPEEYENYGTGDVWYEEENFMIENDPEKKKIIVPTVFLVGSRTGAAAENLLLILKKYRKDVYLVGGDTGGTRGYPMTMGLPGGGNFTLSTTADFYADDTPISSKGIKPDIEVKLKYADYIAGKDTVLEDGYNFLRKKLSK